MSASQSHPSARLPRSIGRVGAAMLALNGVVGAGIFALPGTLAVVAGPSSPVLLVVFGLAMMLVAMPIARIASFYDETGGPVSYAREAFGPWAAFQVGWVYYVARVAALAANASVLADYAARLWPTVGADGVRAALLLTLFGGLAAVNIAGLRRATVALDVVSMFKFVPLIVLALVGLTWLEPETGLAAPQFSQFEQAALIALYSFIGFENALIVAGETRDARRTLPKILLASLTATIILYALIQTAYIAVMGSDAESQAPLVAFGSALAGDAGAWAILVIALLSITGNLLGGMAAVPRVTFALAEERSLPAWFAKVHPRFKSPATSIGFAGLFAAALAVTGGFVALAVVATLARVIVYFISIAALPFVARKRSAPALPGIVWPAVYVASLGLCALIIAQAGWDAWRVLAVLVAAGTLLLAVSGWRRRAMRPGRSAAR